MYLPCGGLGEMTNQLIQGGGMSQLALTEGVGLFVENTSGRWLKRVQCR